jgi:hypothetical protein
VVLHHVHVGDTWWGRKCRKVTVPALFCDLLHQNVAGPSSNSQRQELLHMPEDSEHLGKFGVLQVEMGT